MASRGMGDIAPSKMPKGKKKARRDDTDFTQYAEGGKVKSKVNEAGNYTKPELRKRIFNSVKAAAIVGTGAGQWSARKAQVMAKRYKAAGGGYSGKKTSAQKNLSKWTDEKWTTKSGKPSTQGPKATGERYLPKKAIESLSPAEYAATTKAKRTGKAAGKQFVAQPKRIAKKTSGFR